uniref:Uncharacterized protein n=1 Tax=Setaria italica TaxID=4555 RepID=K3YBP3_SETIT
MQRYKGSSYVAMPRPKEAQKKKQPAQKPCSNLIADNLPKGQISTAAVT